MVRPAVGSDVMLRYHKFVIARLDRAIEPTPGPARAMDAPVKPAHDNWALVGGRHFSTDFAQPDSPASSRA
jgi:hypothetical protein